jgi:hypothetical protein
MSKGGVEVYLYSLTSAIDRVGVQRHVPAALPPGKTSVTHCGGGWLDPIVGLDGCGKSRAHRESIPGTAKIKILWTKRVAS